jgi:hypothetical protein
MTAERDPDRGRYEDTDALLESALRLHPLTTDDVIKFLDVLEEDARMPSFPHPDDDDGACSPEDVMADALGSGDSAHTSLSVARSLPRGLGDDDDEAGHEAAAVERAAMAGETPPKPGCDPLDYQRAELGRVVRTHRHYATIARPHEQPTHDQIARLLETLARVSDEAGDDGLGAVARVVERFEAEVDVPATRGRFYSEPAEPYKHLVEDTQTVTCLCSSTFADISRMVSHYLNGEIGHAAAARLEVLERLDGKVARSQDASPGGGAA